jgi:hypothetical protein
MEKQRIAKIYCGGVGLLHLRIRIRIRMFIFLLRLYKTKCILLRHFKLDYKPPADCVKYFQKREKKIHPRSDIAMSEKTLFRYQFPR